MRIKTPTVYQMEATECGAASLAMILAHWGCNIPLEQLRIDTGVSRDGCNAKNILRGARKYGLEAHGFRKEPESLKTIDMPCIIHWNFNHFVVLEGFKGNAVYINDPAIGRRKLTYEDLDDCFTGIVLTFSRTDDFKRTSKRHNLLEFAAKRVLSQKKEALVLILLGVLLIIPGLLVPMVSQLFMDQVLGRGKSSWAVTLAACTIVTALFQAGLSCYRDYLQVKLNKKVSLISGHRFFTHLLKLPMSFFDQRTLGDLVGRSENNDTINDFLVGDLTRACLELLTAVFYLLLLLRYSVPLLMLGLCGVAINLIIADIASKRMASVTEKQQVDEGKLRGIIYSGISIEETLKASGVENEYCARILGQQAKSASMSQNAGFSQSVLAAVASVLDSVFDVAMLLLGGMMVIQGKLTAGMLVAFLSLFESFSEPVQTLIGFVQKAQQLKADMNRVQDVQSYAVDPALNEDTPKATFDGKIRGSIDMEHVSFGYSLLEAPLIKDLSISMRPGSSVALVGASGSGKSTVGKLISGLYMPWEGSVCFDGVPRQNIPANVFNASVATVSQNVVLFSGTMRDNLTMWNSNILESDMIRAAKDACIHDIITAKHGGYDHILSENAENLSGGQRQRLEIARALTLNPSVLILDEATSALDPMTEKEIVDNIKRRGCTCVVVAHRLSAIRDCDEILVLDRGCVVQRGSHDEMIAMDGPYSNLVKNM